MKTNFSQFGRGDEQLLRLKEFQIAVPTLGIQQAVIDELKNVDSGWDGDILKIIVRISGGKVKGFDYL